MDSIFILQVPYLKSNIVAVYGDILNEIPSREAQSRLKTSNMEYRMLLIVTQG